MLPQTFLILHVRCFGCKHRGPADLQAIIDAGQGDKPIKKIPLRQVRQPSHRFRRHVAGCDGCSALDSGRC
jgi:hypothetical protein